MENGLKTNSEILRSITLSKTAKKIITGDEVPGLRKFSEVFEINQIKNKSISDSKISKILKSINVLKIPVGSFNKSNEQIKFF